MSKRIYVGNLPYSIGDAELQDLVAKAGASQINSATVIMDRASGRSKGFGFVEIENDAEMQPVIDALNGTEMQGRTLVVNEARPFEARTSGPRPGGFGGQGGGAPRYDRGGDDSRRDNRDSAPREESAPVSTDEA